MANALRTFIADVARRIADRWGDEKVFSRTLIESMPGVAYCYDESGQFLRWNRNFELATGYSAAEIARMHPLDFFAAEDRALLAARIAEVFAKGESSVEAPFIGKDGRSSRYFFTGRRVQLEGRACLVGVGIDVSERTRATERLAESELRYRELVEHANSIILRWNAEGRVTFLNEFGQRFFGYSAEEILGQHVLGSIVPPVDSNGRDLRQLMEDICSAPETFSENVNENMRHNGERVWVSWTNRIVRDSQGQVAGLLSVGTDITERRNAEVKLRKLEEQVRQAQKMEAIGQLAGGVAHDFNNILWAILGNIQLAMADTHAEHPARESLDEIEKATLRARSLVRQILTFARHQPQERRIVDLRPTLEEAARFLRSTIPATVDLQFLFAADLPAVCADATQVYQALANLCTNAWHALGNGPGRIEVRAESVTLDETAAGQIPGLTPGRFVCLCVTDTGAGMDAAILPRIFEPFFTTKAAGRGTGLGLSVVHGIMQGHEGAITVATEPGHGATFKLYFPAALGQADAIAATPPEQGSGERILYLDDEESLVFLATRVLKRLGYQVSGFISADDALHAFRADPSRFDLVITDLNMPGMAGLQVAAELLKIRPDLPVVLCSGFVTDELRDLARKTGIREVFYKPSTIEEFSQAIHRLAAHTRSGN